MSNFSIEETTRALAVGPVATYQGLMNLLEAADRLRNLAHEFGHPLEQVAVN